MRSEEEVRNKIIEIQQLESKIKKIYARMRHAVLGNQLQPLDSLISVLRWVLEEEDFDLTEYDSKLDVALQNLRKN